MQARALPQPAPDLCPGQAGEVLVRLGRAEAGRKLIDEVARDAARLTDGPVDGYARASVARRWPPSTWTAP